MIKVLMINYEYPPLGGGGSNATKYILEHLSREPKIEIDLITTSSKNRYYTQSINSNVRIYFLPIKKKHLQYWKENEILGFLVKAIFFTRKLLQLKKYDLVHAIFGFPSGMIPFIFRDLPYIISLRGSDVPGFNIRFDIQYIFLKPLFRKIWKNAKFIIANSQGLKKLSYKTLKDRKIDVIPNGVDMTEFYQKSNYRTDINSVIKILTVSRLIKRKRIEDLLYSIKKLKSENLNVDLTIIGEGKNEAALKKLSSSIHISDCVHFRGYVPHSELPKYYTEADVFVLPSLNEGMSNTALEAMSCGLPLILTKVGGTSELISNNGYSVNVKKPKQIARAISNIYYNPELNKVMGTNSRSHARNFDWQNVARRYLKLYRKCLQA